MINVVIFAKGKPSLLTTICSVLYQVQSISAHVMVLKEEQFDEGDYSSYPISFYNDWKDIRTKLENKKNDEYICFLKEGDTLSSPFVFNVFLEKFGKKSCEAVFGSYIMDKGNFDFSDIGDDYHHFYGKMYRLKFFLKNFKKTFSYSQFFYINQLLVFKKLVVIDNQLRGYMIGNENYFNKKHWEINYCLDEIIQEVYRLFRKCPKESYDLIISVLLHVYIRYIKTGVIPERKRLVSIIPKEISFSENNLNVVKDNDTQIYLLCCNISFIEFLKRLKEESI